MTLLPRNNTSRKSGYRHDLAAGKCVYREPQGFLLYLLTEAQTGTVGKFWAESPNEAGPSYSENKIVGVIR
jgi:hypothetical protein